MTNDELKEYALKMIERYSASAIKNSPYPSGQVSAKLAEVWAIVYSGANHG